MNATMNHAPTSGSVRMWALAFATLIAGVWVWIAGWGLAAGVTGAVWPGVDARVIMSGSMEPALSPGDLILTAAPEPGVVYDPPTVITFEHGEDHITHRIVEVVDGRYRTQGDANAAPDPLAVEPGEVVGVGRLVIPWVGLPIHWWQAGTWWWSILAVVSVGAAWWVMRNAMPDDDDVRDDPASVRRSVVAAGVLVLAFVVAATTSLAFFAVGTSEAGVVSSDGDFGRGPYDQMILADGPAAYWRLGETLSGGGASFTDDFETFAGWSPNPQGGSLIAASAPAGPGPGGVGAALKTDNSDPAGAGKDLGFSVDDFSLSVWVHRTTPFAGGQADRISVETTGGDGYGFIFNHSSDQIGIERRTGGTVPTRSSLVSIVDQLDIWYRAELTKAGTSFSLEIFDDAGGLVGQASWSDGAHTGGFTRVVVRGGWQYFVDDLTVVEGAGSLTSASDASGYGIDGSYVAVAAPASGLIADPDGSVDFGSGGVQVPDSSSINLGSRPERTVSLWFDASPGGRQLLYEEGGTVNGLNLYLDGSTLYGRAWSSNWAPTELQVTASVTPGIHHVGLALDAPGGTLTMVVDGTVAGVATKSDSNDWLSHSDDTGIARVNGATKFHDGNSSAPSAFRGRIDEVAVFNSALSVARIAEHWANGTG